MWRRRGKGGVEEVWRRRGGGGGAQRGGIIGLKTKSCISVNNPNTCLILH